MVITWSLNITLHDINDYSFQKFPNSGFGESRACRMLNTAITLYSGHHQDLENCLLQGGVRKIQVNLKGFLRIGFKIVCPL